MKKITILLLISISILISCRTGIGDAESVKAVIPANVPLSAPELEKLFHVDKTGKSGVSLEITVYDYSSGPEVMRYSDEGLSEFTRDSRIKLLIKVKKNSKLAETHFITATGKKREDLLKNLSVEIEKLK